LFIQRQEPSLIKQVNRQLCCGAGRDYRWLLEHGYAVSGVGASEGMPAIEAIDAVIRMKDRVLNPAPIRAKHLYMRQNGIRRWSLLPAWNRF